MNIFNKRIVNIKIPSIIPAIVAIISIIIGTYLYAYWSGWYHANMSCEIALNNRMHEFDKIFSDTKSEEIVRTISVKINNILLLPPISGFKYCGHNKAVYPITIGAGMAIFGIVLIIWIAISNKIRSIRRIEFF